MARVEWRGDALGCKCGSTDFTTRYIHNPYGHDAGEHIARCASCGTEYRGSYYDFKPLDPPGSPSAADAFAYGAARARGTEP